MRARHSLLSVSTAALIVLQPNISAAQTQTSPSEGASPAPRAEDAANSETPDVGDIVVTANKREQRLQDVPQSISFVGAPQIAQQNINNLNQLDRAAPSLGTNGGALKIRGVGAQTFSRSSEGSVGVVLDGVALANTSVGGGLFNLFDVARVEVLNGPQGTLFGRNTSAGVINVVTNAPDPNRSEMAAHIEAGDQDAYRAQAMVNLPIGGAAALRLVGFRTRPVHTIFNVPRYGWDDQTTSGARARLLVQASPSLTLNLIGDYSQLRQSGGGWVVRQAPPGAYLTTQLAACGIVPDDRNRRNCSGGDRFAFTRAYGGSFQADLDLSGYTVTSITANRWLKDDSGGDSDNLPVDVLDINTARSSIENFSQELRLTSPSGGRVEFVLGAYYFNGKLSAGGIQAGSLRIVPFGLRLGTGFQTTVDSDSLAGFGQATVRVVGGLRGIVGLRLERQTIQAQTRRFRAPGAVAAFGTLTPVDGAYRDTDFSYRLGAQYDFTRDVMAYVTFARGYKGAAVNDNGDTTLAPAVVLPETPKSLEAGIKATVLSGRLGLNLSAFRNDIDNFQTQFFDPTVGAAGAFVYGNAPSSRSQGIEFSMLGTMSEFLSLQGGVTYTDATYGGGYRAACAPLQTAAQGCAANNTFDASGRQFTTVPKWKATVSGELKAPVATDLEGYLQSDLVYTSRISYVASPDPEAVVGDRFLLGGRIGVRTGDGRVGFSIFARNLLNQVVPTNILQTPLAPQLGAVNSHIQFYGPESFRSFGGAIDIKF